MLDSGSLTKNMSKRILQGKILPHKNWALPELRAYLDLMLL